MSIALSCGSAFQIRYRAGRGTNAADAQSGQVSDVLPPTEICGALIAWRRPPRLVQLGEGKSCRREFLRSADLDFNLRQGENPLKEPMDTPPGRHIVRSCSLAAEVSVPVRAERV